MRIAQFTNKGDIKGHSLKSGHETQDPATWGPRHETLRPGNLGPWDMGPWSWDPGTLDPDIQDPGSGSLKLGTCDPETQNPKRRTLRTEHVTQIPSLS